MFHLWVSQIATHTGISKETIKELVLLKLGNTTHLLGEKIALRSSKYKTSETDLNQHDREHDLMPMSDLLTKMEAWAATDLKLTLESNLEEHSQS